MFKLKRIIDDYFTKMTSLELFPNDRLIKVSKGWLIEIN